MEIYSLSALKLPIFVGGVMPYKARMCDIALPTNLSNIHGGKGVILKVLAYYA
ncbi:hypothetical protein SAMD00079811_04980 [Scytonema sp. HK-05]|nr:hypothetical protein SAMD00079811_04980 [Scytonema sp. HK-05]